MTAKVVKATWMNSFSVDARWARIVASPDTPQPEGIENARERCAAREYTSQPQASWDVEQFRYLGVEHGGMSCERSLDHRGPVIDDHLDHAGGEAVE